MLGCDAWVGELKWLKALRSITTSFDRIQLNNCDTGMQVNSPTAQPNPVLLETLPDFNSSDDACPRRARTQIDFLLLAIEALDLSGSEAFLQVAKELGLQDVVKGRVHLWKLRSTNPLRRFSQRDPLSLAEGKALTLTICHQARRLTVMIRQLLLAQQQLREKQLSYEHSFPLATYLNRFRTHFRARMNPNRAAVMAYSSDDTLNELAIALLGQLLFCTGTAGAQRLWASLFDGEVA
jgi:Protein of unknown function (DUF3038)